MCRRRSEAIFSAIYAQFVPTYLLEVVTVGWRLFTFYLPVLVGSVLVLALFPKKWLINLLQKTSE